MQFPSIDLTIILPIAVLAGAGLAVLLLDLVLSEERRAWNAYAALGGILLAGLATAYQAGRSGTTLADMAVLDGFGLAFEWLLLGIAVLSVLFSMPYVRQQRLNRGEYYVLLLFVTAGGMVMATANDLIAIFLGYELLSLSLYVLAAFARERATSGEAGMKYLLLGGFASAFLLYGIALTFGATGTTNLAQIAAFFGGGGAAGPLPLIGLAMLLIGFGFKVAAAPFHAWVPDVYEGAPTSVTAFMSAAAKAAGFAALARVLFVAFPALSVDWTGALAGLAILTMTVGNVAALLQNNVKRLLAYSGIAHAGYVLVALVAATANGLAAALFYLVAYTFMNLGAWSVVLALGAPQSGGHVGDGRDVPAERLAISDFAGLSARKPLLAALMALFLLSLAGIPPTAGLMGKWLVFSAAVEQDQIALAVIGVLNSVVSLAYYLRVISVMYTRPAEPSLSLGPVARPLALVIALSAAGTLALGFLPAPVLQWVHAAGF